MCCARSFFQVRPLQGGARCLVVAANDPQTTQRIVNKQEPFRFYMYEVDVSNRCDKQASCVDCDDDDNDRLWNAGWFGVDQRNGYGFMA